MGDIRCNCCNKAIDGKYFQDQHNNPLCVSCNREMSETCVICRKLIEEGVTGKVARGYVHAACFTCADCGRQITGRYQRKSDLSKQASPHEFTCEECANDYREKCIFCFQTVDPGDSAGKFNEDNHFHARCFQCSECKKEIHGSSSSNFLHQDP